MTGTRASHCPTGSFRLLFSIRGTELWRGRAHGLLQQRAMTRPSYRVQSGDEMATFVPSRRYEVHRHSHAPFLIGNGPHGRMYVICRYLRCLICLIASVLFIFRRTRLGTSLTPPLPSFAALLGCVRGLPPPQPEVHTARPYYRLRQPRRRCAWTPPGRARRTG